MQNRRRSSWERASERSKNRYNFKAPMVKRFPWNHEEVLDCTYKFWCCAHWVTLECTWWFQTAQKWTRSGKKRLTKSDPRSWSYEVFKWLQTPEALTPGFFLRWNEKARGLLFVVEKWSLCSSIIIAHYFLLESLQCSSLGDRTLCNIVKIRNVLK